MNIVLDTNVLISATIWHNSVAQKLLFALISADAKIYTSLDIISEYQKVLRSDFGYYDIELAVITNKILKFASAIKPAEGINAVKEDKEDNKIIECSIASNAEIIATYDKHLLKLGNYQGIAIKTPEELLTQII